MNNIPDISYHNIFCFLPLHQLVRIAQCNKELNRIVTEPSFFNMYPFDSAICPSTNTLELIKCTTPGPFIHLVKQLYFSDYCPSDDYEWFFPAAKLNKILPIFTRLKYLYIYVQKAYMLQEICFSSSNLIQTLEKLTLQFVQFHIDDNDDDNAFIHQIIHQVRLFINLKELDLKSFFTGDMTVYTLENLCALSIATPKLSKLTQLENIHESKHEECAKLLSRLPQGLSLSYCINNHCSVPILFRPWIQNLKIQSYTTIHPEMMNRIHQMTHLDTLSLEKCDIPEDDFIIII
jgi:hypothetical protein